MIGDFESFELLREVAQQATSARIILAGVIGPAFDDYATGEALKEEDAFGRAVRFPWTLIIAYKLFFKACGQIFALPQKVLRNNAA